MANKAQAVVFDYKAVFQAGQAGTTPHPDIAQLLHVLHQQGVAWVLLTTQSIDAAALCSAAGLPQPALHLSQDDIPGRKSRGSGLWLDQTAERLHLRKNQLVIVGTTEWDWYTGIHAGVLYIHARWASALGRKIDALSADDPAELYWLLDRYLLHEPRWLFALDDVERRLQVRSLFQPDETFPGTSPSSFNLKTVFTYDQTVTVGDESARDILMVHLLCSAYLDGSLPGGAWFCVYPSSSPGRVNDQLAEFLKVAKVMVGSYYKGDLLVRATQATDTSMARAARRHDTVSIATQATTVHLNPKHRNSVRGKTVIVFDDFTTEGMSLDWARNLLSTAGAREVIGVTIGKYRKPYTVFTPRPGVTINAFAPNTLTPADFTTEYLSPGFGTGPGDLVRETMSKLITRNTGLPDVEPRPVTQPRIATPTRVPTNAPAAPRLVSAGRRVPMRTYKNGRHRHIGDILNQLVPWHGEYLYPAGKLSSMALWWFAPFGGSINTWWSTREAEALISTMCEEHGIIWEPVPPPYSETARLEAVQRIERRRAAGG
ncbi:hypothetical protein Slala03_51920 [Streptomyces lavendulae subsp. lavendulae]|uniref:hypothetical protein n=1 Tax=Streptomyces lavendulae TaxID=1914 RepID=UPI0024A29B17|nr:hypothetical protein [Streptomyces lavendulae]GLV85503.1 hypothetical protein Slala03_51920 [Streptomyces lavendulae subsp. lavendulae]